MLSLVPAKGPGVVRILAGSYILQRIGTLSLRLGGLAQVSKTGRSLCDLTSTSSQPCEVGKLPNFSEPHFLHPQERDVPENCSQGYWEGRMSRAWKTSRAQTVLTMSMDAPHLAQPPAPEQCLERIVILEVSHSSQRIQPPHLLASLSPSKARRAAFPSSEAVCLECWSTRPSANSDTGE